MLVIAILIAFHLFFTITTPVVQATRDVCAVTWFVIKNVLGGIQYLSRHCRTGAIPDGLHGPRVGQAISPQTARAAKNIRHVNGRAIYSTHAFLSAPGTSLQWFASQTAAHGPTATASPYGYPWWRTPSPPRSGTRSPRGVATSTCAGRQIARSGGTLTQLLQDTRAGAGPPYPHQRLGAKSGIVRLRPPRPGFPMRATSAPLGAVAPTPLGPWVRDGGRGRYAPSRLNLAVGTYGPSHAGLRKGTSLPHTTGNAWKATWSARGQHLRRRGRRGGRWESKAKPQAQLSLRNASTAMPDYRLRLGGKCGLRLQWLSSWDPAL